MAGVPSRLARLNWGDIETAKQVFPGANWNSPEKVNRVSALSSDGDKELSVAEVWRFPNGPDEAVPKAKTEVGRPYILVSADKGGVRFIRKGTNGAEKTSIGSLIRTACPGQ